MRSGWQKALICNIDLASMQTISNLSMETEKIISSISG